MYVLGLIFLYKLCFNCLIQCAVLRCNVIKLFNLIFECSNYWPAHLVLSLYCTALWSTTWLQRCMNITFYDCYCPCRRYMVCWLSSVGPVVHLSLPLAYSTSCWRTTVEMYNIPASGPEEPASVCAGRQAIWLKRERHPKYSSSNYRSIFVELLFALILA